ncbi:MAG: hypothetical protein E6Q76_17465 [Rhizobium sp.]|nr:MAG: hypothetical protein E6Q76_17465 [Rhizobium sp.]
MGMNPLIVRVNAAQSVIDKFLGQPFQWGSSDCACLAAFSLRQLGYDNPLSGIETYGTYRGAKKAMKRAGITGFADHFEQKLGLERIAPAMALPGDLVLIPGEHPETFDGALGVAIGQGRILGFANGIGDFAPDHICTAAWRALPQGGAV